MNCLTRCSSHSKKSNWWDTFEYYGCRACGQSRFFYYAEYLTALLNHNTGPGAVQALIRQGQSLSINWFIYRDLFDFDDVYLLNATDEEVERFAVQVGNDTDPVRAPRYKQMRCLVSPACHLSANTLRILERTFGQIEIGQVLDD